MFSIKAFPFPHFMLGRNSREKNKELVFSQESDHLLPLPTTASPRLALEV
jgi:hypothetical protein